MNANVAFCFELSELTDRAALTELPICCTGHWVKDSRAFEITADDLRSIVANFRKRPNAEVPIDYEHGSENPAIGHGGPVPASGWIKSLTVRPGDDGKMILWASCAFTDEARKLIGERKYRYVSPALDFDSRDKVTGRSKGATLTSMALTNRPFLEELPAIQLSDRAGKVVAVPIPDDSKLRIKIDTRKHGDASDADDESEKKRFADLPAAQKVHRISRAIAERHHESLGMCPDIQGLSDDHAIVKHDGQLYRVGYSIGPDGNIVVAAPEKEKPFKGKVHQARESAEEETVLDDGMQRREREVSYTPSETEEEKFHRSGEHRQHPERDAERRAAKIDEAADDDKTEELADQEDQGQDPADSPNRLKVPGSDATVPRLRVRRMRSAGHHAVVDANGKIAGFISHDDLTSAAREAGNGQGEATKQVMARTEDALKRNPKQAYSQALQSVLLSDEDLRSRYREEHSVLL